MVRSFIMQEQIRMAARVRACNYVNLRLVGIIELLLKIATCTAQLRMDVGHKPLLLSMY